MKLKSLLLIVIALVGLDQLSKFIILGNLTDGQQIVVIPDLFNLTLVYNKGVAFGLMSNWPDLYRTLVISLVSLAAFGLLAWLFHSSYRYSKIHSIALSLILAGALGNIIDRARIGKVVDFLDFYYGEYHWPAFNLADSLICIGVFLLIITKDPQTSNSDEKEQPSTA